MSRTPHTRSYYAASAHDSPDRPCLAGPVDTDVCVIGGGFTGLSSALHLAEAGYNVVLLEAARIGFGASGRNGGQLVNSYSRDIDVIERAYGSELAGVLGNMAFEGAEIIRQRIQQYDIDCAYRQGGVFAAFNARQMHELKAQKKLWERYGHEQLTLLEQADIRDVVKTDVYCGGLLDMSGGHIHPLNLALGEAAALEELGGQIYEDSRVVAVERGNKVVVKTADGGLVRSQYVMIAGNAYLGNLIPELAAKTMPCGTQVVATEVLGEERARSLIPELYCIEDCNYKLDYYRITEDFRLLYGGGVTYGGGDPASIERFIRKKLETTFPQLRGVKIEYTWGGDFLLTLSRLPQFGRIGNNIYYAQGYSGHGVTTTHLAGKLIAEAIKGQAERFDAFASLKHFSFPGGRLFRAPYTAIGAVYYGLRDKLGI
ncbi:NAD(P)/FAD-dependent oxidoreductase [Gynuella sp.]|uniref:NAD(P)/FAD-dependent oxidoreductase n=1 Tax=Gynuella sp. TaxID=2969146 RepID=UPI003D1400AB